MKRKIIGWCLRRLRIPQTVKFKNLYWPDRWDEVNILDYVSANHRQQAAFAVKVNGTASHGQSGHYWEVKNEN